METSKLLLGELSPTDPFKELVDAEIATKWADAQRFQSALRELLKPRDPDYNRSAIVEITAGVGGDEACIFAGELYRMYERFCSNSGWEIDEFYLNGNEGGGIKSITFIVEGKGAYGHLRHESGIHRVQRFSATASKDVMHTSAAVVIVLPQKNESLSFNKDDVKEEAVGTSGPGGQASNKGTSGCRLTHLPTGITAFCQDTRSLINNTKRAWTVLTARLEDHFKAIKTAQDEKLRKSYIGTASRSEKIRTYNFPRNEVIDHRIDKRFELKSALSGDISELIIQLNSDY